MFKRLSILAFTVIILFILFFIPKHVYAKQLTNPDNQISFNLKRLKEKFILFTKFSKQKKFDYTVKLSQVRFEELVYIIEDKNIAFIETVNDRFQTNIGEIIDYIESNDIYFDKKALSDLFLKQKDDLKELQKTYTFNIAEWRFIQDNINTLEILINRTTSD